MELFIALAGIGLGYFLGSLKREADDAVTFDENFDESAYTAVESEQPTTEVQEEK